eukprot:Gb_04356 [translate_table: standard]
MASTLIPATSSIHTQEEYPDHYKGVKALVDRGVDSLPHIYVRPPDERLVEDFSQNELPLIDLAQLEGEGRASVVQAIGQACRQCGFFLVKNHGVSKSILDAEMRVAREFFHLPSEEKMRYFSTDSKSRMRYGTSFNAKEDKVLNWRDFLRFSCHPLEEMIPLWPDKPHDLRQVNAEYCRQLTKLGLKLLGCISESLGLGSQYINQAFGEIHHHMAYNFYPACPKPDLTLGFPGHTDPWGITILMQGEVPGLQVLQKDRWVVVQPIPDTFVVNLGDMMQILSNGKYKSAEHRAVVNSKQERISVPSGYGPSMDKFIAPAPQLLDSANPAVYKGCVFGEYINEIQSKSFIQRKGLLDSMKIHN